MDEAPQDGNAYLRSNAAWTSGGTLTDTLITSPKTVATLAAATIGAGARSFVSDATAATFNSIVTGGGTNAVPVFSDGTSWRIG
jgi:hypothetical protein